MTSDDDTMTCDRCRRSISIYDTKALAWEALGGGERVVCNGCLTAPEQRAIDAVEEEAALSARIDTLEVQFAELRQLADELVEEVLRYRAQQT